MHAVGGVPHWQLCWPAAPPQVSPLAQATGAPAVMHPVAASRVHVTVALPEQYVPGPAPQIAGVAAHAQAAFGNVPPHTNPPPHGALDASVTQWLAVVSATQVTRLPLVSHSLPAPPGHCGGSAGQAQRAVPGLPVHTCAPGHGVLDCMTRHGLASLPQVTSEFP